MKCAVISSKQLGITGRWDAGYNIAYAENLARIEELLKRGSESLVRRHLLRLAISVPPNAAAYQTVAKAQAKNREFTREWLKNRTNQELAVYVSIAVTKENIEVALRAVERDADKVNRRRNRLSSAAKEVSR